MRLFIGVSALCMSICDAWTTHRLRTKLLRRYYFERGEHRDVIPELGDVSQCSAFFWEQVGKDRADTIKGWLDYDKNCSRAMVKLGEDHIHVHADTHASFIVVAKDVCL